MQMNQSRNYTIVFDNAKAKKKPRDNVFQLAAENLLSKASIKE